jgi:hypothetical protein
MLPKLLKVGLGGIIVRQLNGEVYLNKSAVVLKEESIIQTYGKAKTTVMITRAPTRRAT